MKTSIDNDETFLVDGRYTFRDLVDIEKLDAVLQKFSLATGFTTGLVSFPKQELLISSGWRDICTKFHRVHPEASQSCKNSNLFLTSRLKESHKWSVRTCENGLIDAATPILVQDTHVASLFTGQILFEKPDRERFHQQALRFDFDPEAYLKALDAVPVVTEEQLRRCLDFLSSLAVLIAEEGLAGLRQKHNEEHLKQLLEEQQNTQKCLEERETNLRITLDSIGDAVISTDTEGHVVRINPMASRYTGWSAEQAIGQPLDEVLRIVHVQDRSPCENPVREVLSKEKIAEVDRDALLISKDGQEYRIADSAAPILDTAGNTTGVVLVFRDVSEEYRIQDDLLQERDFSSSIVKNTSTFICSIAPDGTVRFINPAGETISGYKSEEILGQNYWKTLYPREQYDQVRQLFEAFQNNEVKNFEMPLTTKSGEQRIISWNSFKRFNNQGQLTEIIGLGADITERKRAENALEKRLVALTKPLDDNSEISFEDLFNLHDFQQIQDEFSNATGVASIITHTDGTPITKPSNFCRLCNDIIRKTEKGRANCYKSDAALGRFNETGPIVQPCMSSGLWDAGASISVGGKHIANWLIGQVRDDTQNEENMRRYARAIGANEQDVLKAFQEVPQMPLWKFEKISLFLFTVANQLSSIAYQNIQQARTITKRKQAEKALQQRIAQEKLISEISTRFIDLPAEAIDENIENSLYRICTFLDIDAGYLLRFDSSGKTVRMTHLWQSTATSIDKNFSMDLETSSPPWWLQNVLENNRLCVPSVDSLEPDDDVKVVLSSNVHSLVEIAVVTQEKNVAVLGLASHLDGRNWSEEEVSLLRMAGQVFVNGLLRQKSEREHREHVAFLEHLDRFDTAIRHKTKLDDLLRSALDSLREIFNSDRAFVSYPLDPNADYYFVPMQSANKKYRVENLNQTPLPMDTETRRQFSRSLLRKTPQSVSTIEADQPPSKLREQFSVKSILFTPMFPTVDRPWLLGMHQCSHPRRWSRNDRNLFKEIARRFEDALNATLIFQNLQNNRRWLFTTLSSVADPVLTTNSDGEIIFMNEAAQAFSGRAFSHIDTWSLGTDHKSQGLCLNEVLDLREPSGEPLSSPLAELIKETHQSVYEKEGLARNHTGENRVVLISGSRIRNAENQVIGMVLVLRDITDQRTREAMLRHQQKLEAIGTLAGGVAHEINNPIGIIMNYAQLILDDSESDSSTAQDAAMIVSESRRIAEIVKNLLSFSRQDMESHSPANLRDVLHATLNLTNKILSKFNILMELEVPTDIPRIKCRSQQIMQVLMNLITNAKDALNERYPGHHENKRISIRISQIEKEGKPWLRTSIRDWGGGIPKSIAGRVFDPFFTSKDPGKGTGLGLSVSHGIIKDHGGNLWFENVPGEGVTFYMDLPINNGWQLETDIYE